MYQGYLLYSRQPVKYLPKMDDSMTSLQSVLEFDGEDDFINLGKKPEFKIEKTVTLEAWIYCQNQRRRTGILTNVFDTTDTESGYGLLLDGKSGIFFALKTPDKRIRYLSSQANSLSLNQWHHIAATYDGQEMKVYIDGEEKNSKSVSDEVIHYDPENDLLIGAYQDNNETYPFQGKITDVRLWQICRTQKQIQDAMHQRLQGNEAGLMGYWSLQEGSGNQATDQTSQGNHGIINGATWGQAELPINGAKSTVKVGENKTMAKSNKSSKSQGNKGTSGDNQPEEIQRHLQATGLEDYGFWWQEMAKEQAKHDNGKPFRRGRIWT